MDVRGQSFPDTEICLFELRFRSGTPELKSGVNITQHVGYDNQPWFDPASTNLYYSTEADSGSTEIARYDLLSKKTIRLTQTPENEFSPRLLKGGLMTALVQFPSGEQAIGFYAGGKLDSVALLEQKPGYYLFLPNRQLVSFLVGPPQVLVHYDLKRGTRQVISDSIGRTFQGIPRTEMVAYVRKSSSGSILYSYQPRTAQSQQLLRLPPGSEDFVWLNNGTILASTPTRLYLARPGVPVWREVPLPDLIKGKRLSRLAASDNGKMLAIVIQ